MFQNQLIPRRWTRAGITNLPGVFGGLQGDMSRLFEDFWGDIELPTRSGQTGFAAPRIDVSESADGYRISAEMPGASEADIEVEVSDGVLSIKGEKARESEPEEARYHLRERSYDSYRREFRLPPTADAKKISAKFEDGLLNITVPKLAEAKANSRRIAIEKS